jgi:PAS domain S-box-containing protein
MSEPQPKILVVDDNPPLSASAVRALKGAGYWVTSAATGREALQMARRIQPDLVLLDVALPDIDGVEVCRRIKATAALSSTYVLLISGRRREVTDQVQGLDAGADGYLVRPIANAELRARVAALLRLQRTERALREANAALKREVSARRMLEAQCATQYMASPIPTFTWCRTEDDFVLTDFNDAARAMTQGAIADFVGVKASEFHADRPDIVQDLDHCYTAQTVIRREIAYTFRHQGDEHQLAVSYAFVPPNCVLVHVDDITERKRAERALRESERRFRSTIQKSPVGVGIVDKDGEMIDCNPALADMLGYRRDELLSLNFRDFTHPEDLAYEWELIENLWKGQSLQYRMEKRYIHKEGHILWVDVAASLDRGDSGQHEFGFAFVQDITARKRAEAALRESEARYRVLFNSGYDAVFVHTMTPSGAPGQFVEVNDVACRRLGYARETLLAMSPEDIDLPSSALDAEAVAERLQQEGHALFERVHRAKDGTEIPVEINSHVLMLNERQVVISIARDITARKEAERTMQAYAVTLEQRVAEKVRELERERAKVIQAGKMASLGEMATGVAHEVNQPLTSISFEADYLKLIARRAQEGLVPLDADEIYEVGENLSGDVMRCRRITDHLREFGRASLNRVSSVNLNHIVEDSFILVGARLRDHNIDVQLELAPELPLIFADPQKLEQVFLNLISNAEYALAQRASCETADYCKSLVLSTYVDGGWVVAEVQDNGCGIAEKDRARLFEPFFTTKPVGEGTGLGLSISYGIVAECGGEIACESVEDEGTTFTLRFPEGACGPAAMDAAWEDG